MQQGFSARPDSIDGGWFGVRVRLLCCRLADVYKSHSQQFLYITVGTCVCRMLGRFTVGFSQPEFNTLRISFKMS
jgi:hypothetical protein